MKLKTIYLVALLLSMCFVGCAQTTRSICVSADCKDTIQLPTNSITLNSVANSTNPVTSYKWATVGNSALIANVNAQNTTASNLNTVGLYVFSVTATSAAGSAIAYDTVFVKAAIPIPPIVTVLSVTNLTVNGKVIQITINTDGTVITK